MDATEFEGIRWRLKLRQTDLAKVLGVHPVTVNKWEKGARPITRRRISEGMPRPSPVGGR
jgi:DNA-binding transcriptional regulator YiaG